MKKITKKELMNNRFAKIKNNVITYEKPNKKGLSYRDLCLCNAIEGLKFRGIEEALANANYWLSLGDNGRLRELNY